MTDRMNLSVSADRMSLRIELVGENHSTRSISATAAEAEHLIATIAKLRATMIPEVSRTIPDGELSPGPVDPVWAGPSHSEAGERLVAIRHDGIGWIPVLFSQAVAKSLADYLLQGPQQTSARLQSHLQ